MTGWRRWALAIGAVGVAVLGARFQTHSWPSTIMVLVPATVILVVAARQPARTHQQTVPRTEPLRRGLVWWPALAALGLAWEAYAFVWQPDWSRPNHDYPTISTLLDPVLEHGPLRVVGWLIWLAVGWQLVRR